MRRVRYSTSATAFLLTLLITGCGVQPSGVIRGASPPSGPIEPDHTVTLYLVANGKLKAVRRPSRPLPPEEALALLAAGPTTEERARGLTSEVPRGAAPFSMTTQPSDGKVVTTSLPADVLPGTAVDQIVCTVAGPGERVTVLGAGRPRACPVSG